MKNIFFAFVVGVVLVSCNPMADKATTPPAPKADLKQLDISLLSSTKDPVCEMDLTNETFADTAMVDGKVIGFCNVGCKEEFLKK